jgi:hypothetical protein
MSAQSEPILDWIYPQIPLYLSLNKVQIDMRLFTGFPVGNEFTQAASALGRFKEFTDIRQIQLPILINVQLLI